MEEMEVQAKKEETEEMVGKEETHLKIGNQCSIKLPLFNGMKINLKSLLVESHNKIILEKVVEEVEEEIVGGLEVAG